MSEIRVFIIMNKMKNYLKSISYSIFCVLSTTQAIAMANESAAIMGSAGAGAGTYTYDTSGQYYNPALMATQGRPQLVIGGVAEFDSVTSNTISNENYAGNSIVGSELDGTRSLSLLPSLFYSQPVFNIAGRTIWLGISATSPYGENFESSNDSGLRYFSTDFQLNTYNINPAFSILLHPRFSIGAGVSAEYFSTEFTQAKDVGYWHNDISQPGSDAYAKHNATSWGYGWNTGALFRLGQQSFIGASYRSAIQHDLNGDVTFTYPDGIPNLTPIIGNRNWVDQSFSTVFYTPATARLSYSQRLGQRFLVMADVEYAFWSQNDGMSINYDSMEANPNQSISFSDTITPSIGLQYFLTQQFSLKTGFSYVQNPIQDNSAAALYGNEGIVTAVGMGYIYKRFKVDASYAHLFGFEQDIYATTNENLHESTYEGSVTRQVDMIGLQLSYSF